MYSFGGRKDYKKVWSKLSQYWFLYPIRIFIFVDKKKKNTLLILQEISFECDEIDFTRH